jgi:4-amino-4-deoxy-L-arabinose transferase-like glycosyltransferase
MKKEILKHWPILIFVAGFSILVGSHLNDHLLWQDEAETALIALTVGEQGMPMSTDGKNYFTQQLGAEYGEDGIWRYHPWLQYYVMAPFLTVMGPTTLAARLPFAIIGFLSVMLLYLWSYKLTRNIWPGVAGGLFLLSSDLFLSLSGQARYYTPILIFTIALIFEYWNYEQRKKKVHWLFIIYAFLLFHTHYLSAVIVLLILNAHALICNRKNFFNLFVHSTVFAVLHIPYLLWIADAARKIQLVGSTILTDKIFASVHYYAGHAATYIWHPAILIAIALLFYVALRNSKEKNIIQPVYSVATLFVLACSIGISILGVISKENYLRYMAFLLPFTAFFIVQLTNHLSFKQKNLAIVVSISVLILGDIPSYYKRITYKYTGPVESMVNFFQQHAHPNDIIGISYGDLPLAYYLPNRIISTHRPEDWHLLSQCKYVVVRHNVNHSQEVEFANHLLTIFDERYRVARIPQSHDIPYELRETPEYDIRKEIAKAPEIMVYTNTEIN